MGFFSDLKEDVSKAVGDFLPEEDIIEEPIEAIVPQEEVVEPHVRRKKIEPKLDDFVLEPAPEVQPQMEPIEDIASLLDRMEPEPEPEPIRPQAPSLSFAPAQAVSDEISTITSGMYVRGDVTSNGSMDVMGIIEGDINILGKLNVTGTITGASKAAEVYAENAKITGDVTSAGSVKIGQSSVIIGNIYATSAVVAGAVKGDIDVHGPVILDTTAIVMGNVKSKSVQINNGAVIEGMCSQCYADVNPSSFFEELRKKK